MRKGKIESFSIRVIKKTVRMLANLMSRKHLPTKMGTMHFGSWIDAQGELFDTAHFSGSLKEYPFQRIGCYLLLGSVEVDYHFSTITLSKIAKMTLSQTLVIRIRMTDILKCMDS